MKRLKYLLVFIGFLSLAPQQGMAQIDTTFWFPAPWVTPDHWWRDPMAFHFSTFSNPTTIRIQQPASTYDTTFTVPANQSFSKFVDFMIDSVESKPADQILRTGFKITSDYPIAIIYDVITRANQHRNPETYSLKGQNGMGTEFVLPYQTLWNNRTLNNDLNNDGTITQPYQQFSVVATEDSTWIYITPRAEIVGGHPANQTFAVLLPRAGNVYTGQNITQNTSTVGNNLAGTIVVSDKPVSVSVSDDSVNPSGGGGCFDLMGDQIVPTDVIGTEYIVNQGFLNSGSDESLFVVATENFTSVSVDDGTGVTTTILNQGETFQYSITEPLTYVNSDKNVYLLHMSGYGCELGKAILPPLNCSGSDTVSFVRANGQNFLLNLLVPAGSEGDFELNGNAALIPPTAFAAVPGTGGAWMGAQINLSTAQVPNGSTNLITNSSSLFSMGVINGGTTTGCLYHYVSSFLRRVNTRAGNDTTLCTGEAIVALDGSVTGGTTTGEWQVLNGAGILNTPTSLSTTYQPSVSDYNQGSLTFVLGSTGNCDPVYDTIVVSFIESPNVIAGPDDSYCDNNVSAVPLNGSLNFAAGASWSGGNGGAFGNSGNLVTTYTPSPADIAADSVELYLTSAGSFFSCPNDQDTLVIYFTDPPSVVAGPDQVVCSSADDLQLNGSVTGVTTTGVWTASGTGAFSPSGTDLNGLYDISAADTAAGGLWVTLTSTNNGNCLAVQDSFEITFLDDPLVEILTDDTICSNVPSLNLVGNVSSGFGSMWTVNGAGNVVNSSSLNTFYNFSPVDTTNAFIDIFLSTTAGICPVTTDSIRIIFVDPPRVDAGLDQDFCNNEPVQLNGGITGTAPTGTWTTTGTGSFDPSPNLLSTLYYPSATDVANGGVQLILGSTSNFGCTPDADTINVTFIESPVAAFDWSDACEGQNTMFTDQSTVSNGTIVSWLYDFGDNTTSIADDPQHNYPASGDFIASLIVESSNGCFDTISETITVNPVPVADYTYTVACDNQPIFFTDQSFISSGSIVSYMYDFNSGDSISFDANSSFVFGAPGNYPVIYEVTSDLGCVGTLVQNISVLDGPTAAFEVNPNPALALEDVFFTDQSFGNQITDWLWDFGDETGGNNQNEVHTYANGGTYPVELTVTDINGCEDRTIIDVNVALLPVLPTAFTPNGDGENDTYIIRGGPFSSVDFNIYNQWGELIFTSNDPNVGWDGTYQGAEAPIGVYTWTFVVGLAGDRVVTKSGDVTLIR